MLEVRHVTKRFQPNHPPVVNDVSFTVNAGKIAAILGPSGCGKTTTLRLIAGFERADSGTVTLDGVTLSDDSKHLAPETRGIGFVFQDYALFPHLNVLQNVAFGLRGADRVARAREVIALVGLSIFEKRSPHQLFGGQQQRVALARALAPKPKLVLLDEPFSSLDAGLRESTRGEVRDILASSGATALLVTHDQEEAMSFADQLLVMRDGRLEQSGAPELVYAQPRTAFVASFLGKTNLIPARVKNGAAETPFGLIRLNAPSDGAAMLSLRPEDLEFADLEATGAVSAEILTREFKGHDVTYTVRAQQLTLIVQLSSPAPWQVGERVAVRMIGQPTMVLGSS
jgi:iron(III) transport system ATP-binding protein